MKLVATLTATAAVLFIGAAPAHAFEDTLRTHGGFWNWHAYRTMRYDLEGWPFQKKSRGREFHTVDLQTGKIRIDSDGGFPLYHLGFDGRSAWVSPSRDAINALTRFYTLAPFRFIGMPFVLAQAGVSQENLGERLVAGRKYEAYRFRFPPGTDSPSDDFIAYVDDDTRLLHLVTFEVNRREFAVVFDEWQGVDGLTVPRRLSFHEWADGRPGPARASFEVLNVAFDKAFAEPAAFARP